MSKNNRCRLGYKGCLFYKLAILTALFLGALSLSFQTSPSAAQFLFCLSHIVSSVFVPDLLSSCCVLQGISGARGRPTGVFFMHFIRTLQDTAQQPRVLCQPPFLQRLLYCFSQTFRKMVQHIFPAFIFFCSLRGSFSFFQMLLTDFQSLISSYTKGILYLSKTIYCNQFLS